MKLNLVKIGHLYFIFLFILSIVFYMERTLYMDCAYHCFNIINFKWFFIASQRYSVVIPEIIPLLFIVLKAPLSVILLSFSLSYTILYYSVFLLSAYTFKTPQVIFPIILVLTCFSEQSYFHIVTETHQGLIYCILLFSWINYYNIKAFKNPIIFNLVSSLMIFLAFGAHPVTFFPILFIIGFFLIESWHNNTDDRKKIISYYVPLIILTLFGFILRAILTPVHSYDGQFYSQLTANIGWRFLTLYPIKFVFFHYILYAFPAVMVFTLFIYYRRSKKNVLLYYSVLSALVFFVILQLTFGKGDSDVMMEKNFMPFAIFIAIPLCYFFVNKASDRQKKIILGMVFCSVVVGFTTEIAYSKHIRKRIEFYNNLSSFTNETGKRKLLIPSSCAPSREINWAIGAETLLYSSLTGKENSMTAYINDGDTSHLNETNLFLLVPFWKYSDESQLNSNYFDLGHQKYVNITCKGDSFMLMQ